MLHTRKQQTEATMRAMAARNAYRADIVKRAMGAKHACHPANHVQRMASVVVLVEGIETARAVRNAIAL